VQMNKKAGIVYLITASILVISGFSACSSTPSSTPAITSPSIAQSANRSNTQRVGGSTPSSTASSGLISQPTIVLPNKQNKTVTGNGTVTVPKYANLYFGTAGKIAAINIKQGDIVSVGAVLAKLDTTSLEAAVAQSQVSVDQTQANVSQIQLNIITDQSSLVKAKQNLAAQQDVQDIQTKIDNANIQLQQAKLMSDQAGRLGNSTEAQYWHSQIIYLSDDTNVSSSDPKHKPNGGLIGVLQQQMSDLLTDPAQAGAILVSSATAAAQIQQYVLAIQQADAKIVTDQANLVTAQANVITSQNSLKIAQQQLNDATIIAPFNGIVAAVNQNAGDIISAPSQSQHPIIYLIDPTTLELTISVNELDLPKIQIKQKASIMINAFSAAKISGEVTAIAVTPTVQGGIVNYSVTVAFSAPPNLDVKVGMNASAEIGN